jgi:hypothetical protein
VNRTISHAGCNCPKLRLHESFERSEAEVHEMLMSVCQPRLVCEFGRVARAFAPG